MLIYNRVITSRLRFPYATLSNLCMRSHQSRGINLSPADAAYSSHSLSITGDLTVNSMAFTGNLDDVTCQQRGPALGSVGLHEITLNLQT